MTNKYEPFDTLLGHAPGGVAIYSSDYSSINKQNYPDDASFRHYLGAEYMGYKWQCVEFARRFLYLNYGIVFTDVSRAYQIFSLRFLRRVVDDAILPLNAFANGCKRKPVVGALLVWQDGGEFKGTGHVAIITEVLDSRVRIAEQNVAHTCLPAGQNWVRELPLLVTDNGYYIQDTFNDTKILGWMIQTDDGEFSLATPVIPPDYQVLHGNRLDACGQFDKKWLNEEDPLEEAYIQALNGQRINRDDDIYRYFTISKSAEQELIRATNELHLMYLHATNKILNDDNLLKLFNIPPILWPRLRLSWKERRYQMMTGRLDFCMDERGLKVYEYNADSASCHTEAAVILPKWAKQGGLTQGTDPCQYLLDMLSETWKHSDAKPFIHIMRDDDTEEHYHALFMQQALAKAGFASKIICGLEGIDWNSDGQIVDNENREINCVWKTWAWETVLEQLRQESEQQTTSSVDSTVLNGQVANRNVRLTDVLLHPDITVFEPLWTVIPGNKAILPVLWSLFPNHPYLLEASFELNEGFIKNGYAVKPVAGRRGHNIDLVDGQEQVLDKTSGQFEQQQDIYQELWCLPKVAERYIQVCTFTVGGHCGGICLRSDRSLVIKGQSDMQPLRVLDDKDFINLSCA